MSARGSVNDGSKEPIRLPTADLPVAETPDDSSPGKQAKSVSKIVAFLGAVVMSSLWASAVGAYLMGYFGVHGLDGLDAQQWAIFAVATVVPPLLFMALSWVLIRGQAMGEAAETFSRAVEQLFTADETAAHTAARIGRAVRHELDALNAGLETAFDRMNALEERVKNQIAAIDDAGKRLTEQGDVLSARLSQERDRVDEAMQGLTAGTTKTGEWLSDRAGELKNTIDAASNSLKISGDALSVQTEKFTMAAERAAQSPQAAAAELDKQAKRIEQVAETSAARAEFVLGRQARHYAAMNETLQRLKDEGQALETALTAEREAMEHSVTAMSGEAKRFEAVTAEAARRLDIIMAAAAKRTSQMAQTYAHEASGLTGISEAATGALTAMIAEVDKAGEATRRLIDETASRARVNTESLLTSATSECAQLRQTAEGLAAQSDALRAELDETVAHIAQHTAKLPALAEAEAQKVRETVRRETEEMLTLSAKTIATLYARTQPKPGPKPQRALPEAEAEIGRGFFKRRLGGPRPKDGKDWRMSTLLAAAETGIPDDRAKAQPVKPTGAAALKYLEDTLTDMAVDLDAIASDDGPQQDEWRQYLAGDRGVFARKLATAIDGETVHRIAMLYRENTTFRDSAESYLEEFEFLLARMRESDPGSGSLLAATMLSADTGKIYLAISYALGRL